MKINTRWYFDIISEIGNDITLAISFGIGRNNKRDLIHIVAGKYWDVARAVEKIAE